MIEESSSNEKTLNCVPPISVLKTLIRPVGFYVPERWALKKVEVIYLSFKE
jgi:hypothetical protein